VVFFSVDVKCGNFSGHRYANNFEGTRCLPLNGTKIPPAANLTSEIDSGSRNIILLMQGRIIFHFNVRKNNPKMSGKQKCHEKF
jgi:hypothetical protein